LVGLGEQLETGRLKEREKGRFDTQKDHFMGGVPAKKLPVFGSYPGAGRGSKCGGKELLRNCTPRGGEGKGWFAGKLTSIRRRIGGSEKGDKSIRVRPSGGGSGSKKKSVSLFCSG